MFLQNLAAIANTVIPFLVGLCVLAFLAGIIVAIVFAIKAADEQDKTKKKKTIWIIIGCVGGPIVLLFILISLWGLLNVLTQTFAQ